MKIAAKRQLRRSRMQLPLQAGEILPNALDVEIVGLRDRPPEVAIESLEISIDLRQHVFLPKQWRLAAQILRARERAGPSEFSIVARRFFELSKKNFELVDVIVRRHLAQ